MVERIQREASPFNVHYLAAKRGAGHSLASGLLANTGVALPEPVVSFDPTPLEGASYLIRMASYLLPLRASPDGEIAWFRVHVYFDLLAGCERVVLTYGQATKDAPPRRWCASSASRCSERFPLRRGVNKRQWQRTVTAMVRHRSGVAVFPSADGHDEMLAASALGARPPLDQAPAARLTEEALFVLLKHHVPGRCSRRSSPASMTTARGAPCPRRSSDTGSCRTVLSSWISGDEGRGGEDRVGRAAVLRSQPSQGVLWGSAGSLPASCSSPSRKPSSSRSRPRRWPEPGGVQV